MIEAVNICRMPFVEHTHVVLASCARAFFDKCLVRCCYLSNTSSVIAGGNYICTRGYSEQYYIQKRIKKRTTVIVPRVYIGSSLICVSLLV